MTKIAHVSSGSSYSIGIMLPAGYRIASLTNIICKIGDSYSWHLDADMVTLDERTVMLSVGADVTSALNGRLRLEIQIIDDTLGSLILNPVDLIFSPTNNFTPVLAKRIGFDLLFELEIVDNYFQVKHTILRALRGLSTFDVALENGFVGTQPEWLLSLRGDILVILPLVNKGANDVIPHDKDSKLRVLALFNDDDEGRSYNGFYAANATLTEFTLMNDFNNDKFNGSLLCLKY
jgi:hypothetical protein